MLEKNSNVAVVIAVGVLVIAAVIVGWRLGASSEVPRNPYFPPISGTLDYYLSVNEAGDVLPYAPDGTPWVLCQPEDNCGEEGFPDADLGSGAEPYVGFIVIQRKSEQMRAGDKKAVSVSLVEKTYASSPDGTCNVIGYIKIGGVWVARYDPTDPDCPPK